MLRSGPPGYAPAAALLATVALSILFGTRLLDRAVPIVRIGIRWQPGVGEQARAYAARQFSFYEIRPDGEDVWVCLLADTSAANIQGLLASPAIADVAGVSRTNRQPDGIDRIGPLAWLAARYPNLKTEAAFDAPRIVRWAAVVPLFVFCLLAALLWRESGRAWLVERIPLGSPAAMGMFRIALAISWALAVETIPETRPGIRAESLVLLVPFGLGIAPRLALVGLAWVWLPGATHDTSMPAKTLLLLAMVPWSDGISVTETVRRLFGRSVPPVERRIYGLATWIPVLMMGLAYAAAAFAKLDETGLRWITDGVVRYFFVIDAPNAPTGLGRVVASSDWLSVVLAAGAVLAEASIIAAALYSRPLVVLATGVGALALHAGFWWFQGVWWPAWWAMLPAFLPWSVAARTLRRRLPACVLTVDARCAACRRTARVVHAFDWFDRVAVEDTPGTPGSTAEVAGQFVRALRVLPPMWIALPLVAWPPVDRAVRRAAERWFEHHPAGGPSTAVATPARVVRRFGNPAAIPAGAAVVLGIAVLQQPLASLARVEYRPVLSDFSMYSDSQWSSKQEFAAFMDREKTPPYAAVRLEGADGAEAAVVAARLRDVDPENAVVGAARAIAVGMTLDDAQRNRVRAIGERYQERFGVPMLPLRVAAAASWRFDWNVADFIPDGSWRQAGVLDIRADP